MHAWTPSVQHTESGVVYLSSTTLSVCCTLGVHACIMILDLVLLQHVHQLIWGFISLNIVIFHVTVLFGFVGPAHGDETVICGRRVFWWSPAKTGAGAFARVIIVLVHFFGVGISVYINEDKACTHTPAVNLTALPVSEVPTDGACFLLPDLNVVDDFTNCAVTPSRCAWREHWSFTDALYFSLVVVSTVGYGHELIPTTTFARSFT